MVFIWMTEELNLNWGLKNLTVMAGILWRSKVPGNIILGRVPCESSKIVPYFVQWVIRHGFRMLRNNEFQSFTW